MVYILRHHKPIESSVSIYTSGDQSPLREGHQLGCIPFPTIIEQVSVWSVFLDDRSDLWTHTVSFAWNIGTFVPTFLSVYSLFF